jgi:hypothetical protein
MGLSESRELQISMGKLLGPYTPHHRICPQGIVPSAWDTRTPLSSKKNLSCKTSTIKEQSGEGGIRTPDTVARIRHFQCRSLSHSDTSPANSPGCEPSIVSDSYLNRLNRRPRPLSDKRLGWEFRRFHRASEGLQKFLLLAACGEWEFCVDYR